MKKSLSKMSKIPSSSGNKEPGGSSEAPLSQQMKQNARKMNDLVGELQQEHEQQPHHIDQMEQFNKEREGILLQLQQEMCKYMTIQEKFQEQEKSMQFIIKELELDRLALLDKLAVNDVISSDNIEDLNEEVDELQSQLEGTAGDTTCSICLMPRDTEGSHRVVSLRCGHLFGNKCIRRALRNSRQCPICMKRAHPADVRKIYGNTVLPN